MGSQEKDSPVLGSGTQSVLLKVAVETTISTNYLLSNYYQNTVWNGYIIKF